MKFFLVYNSTTNAVCSKSRGIQLVYKLGLVCMRLVNPYHKVD